MKERGRAMGTAVRAGRWGVGMGLGLVLAAAWGGVVGAGEQRVVSAGSFGAGEIVAMARAADGAIVVCGTLAPGEEGPAGGVRPLLRAPEGEGDGAGLTFLARLSADLEELEWVVGLPVGVLRPTAVAVLPDGAVVVGGERGELAAELVGGEGVDWGRGQAALAKVSADGSALEWALPGASNQTAVTGLATDGGGRVYWTAGTMGRQQAAYLIRREGDGGESSWPAANRSWCVDLHHNDPQLLGEGQFWEFYARAKGGGFDYDGEAGPWGAVQFRVLGIRSGGQVLVLPDGDVVVSGTMQYDFKEGGNRWFPAFDLLLARYSPEGQLRWSTNLYREGDSVHTPDQKAVGLSYDAERDELVVLAKQHGSNLYRFAGELRGDTGNLMIGWVGRVAAGSGELEAGWYFQDSRNTGYDGRGLPSGPPHPQLAGNAIEAAAAGRGGRVIAVGRAGASAYSTPGAWQAWPDGQTGGAHAILTVLGADLGEVEYASLLFADVAGQSGQLRALVVGEGGEILVGGSGFLDQGQAAGWRRTGWSGQAGVGSAVVLRLDGF